ncbi:uncharacterized protein LOC142558435 [Dermacentor variabilis]|uniref:uncharacterized protein LOC142558435 n=1 Tax=Dermacentor variabilis TaxID=34621 RepID=UPI003F5B87DC
MPSSKDSVTVKNNDKAVPTSSEAFPTTLPSVRPGSSAQDLSEDGHHLQHQDGMSRPQGLRETQGPGPSEAPHETAFRRLVQPVDTRGNFGSPASVAEGQPSAQPTNLKHGSSTQRLDADGATAATTSVNDSTIADERSTQGVDITSADKYQRGSTREEGPSHAASPSLSGTAASAQLPTQLANTRIDVYCIEVPRIEVPRIEVPRIEVPCIDVSYIEVPCSEAYIDISCIEFPSIGFTGGSWAHKKVAGSDTTDSSKFCDSPTYADLISGHSPKADGRLVSDERGIRRLDHPPSKAEHSSGRPPHEQDLKSRKLSLVHGTPSGSVGRVKPRLIKATGRTVDAQNKERKEDAATPTGWPKVSPSSTFPAHDSGAKQRLEHGTAAAASSQSVATLVSTSPEGPRDPPALPLGEEGRLDKKAQQQMLANLGKPPKEIESPGSQAVSEIRPSPSVGGVQSVSTRARGHGSPASPDKLLFDPHQSQLVLNVKALSPTSGSLGRKAKAGQRFSHIKKMSWPMAELRKFRLSRGTLPSTSLVHHSTTQARVQETLGLRGQWVVASVLALAIIVVVLFIVSRWTLVTENRGIQLCNSDACHKYAGHILLQVNRSLDPCEDFSKYACSAWSPPRTRADYATSSFTQLIRAWFEGFSSLLLDASKHGFTVADGPAAMLRACLNPNTKAGVPGIQELRNLMASVHLNWPDPPEDEGSPLGVLLRLAYDFGVRTETYHVIMGTGTLYVDNAYNRAQLLNLVEPFTSRLP